MRTYLTRHLQVLFATLGDMRRAPVAALTTVLIIGVTLALPILLYILIQSAAQLTTDWRGQAQLSIFLQHDLAAEEAQLIFSELALHPAIQLAEFISPEAALQEFKALTDLDFELSFLDGNPLPASIVVLPGQQHHDSAALLSLRDELAKIEGIEEIRLDLDWVDRFNAIILSVSRATQILSIFLLLALILIVGNTIKLLIMNRRQEIEITKLVGGSNRFVRRPFLYYGALFGFFGALITLLMLVLIGTLMEPPLTQLASMYQRESLLYTLNWREIGGLILFAMFLGWFAARVSVAQHLGQIKPR